MSLNRRAEATLADARASAPGANQSVSGLVDHLFRRKAGQLVSHLTRLLGVHRMELAEDVVQEAMIKALQQWPYTGIPDNPGGWLTVVARNRALDILRREAVLAGKLAEAGAAPPAAAEPSPAFDDPFGDDQLTMVFLCCHPSLPRDAQIVLTLKNVCGFGVGEIARAFLAKPQTVAQRVVRAKRRLREEKAAFELPAGESQLVSRLEAVLRVLYLLFNEGYTVHEGRDLVREDLCAEAIRLAQLLCAHPVGDRPEVHALAALMLFQASRLDARTDGNGNLKTLAEQDRSRWDMSLVGAAFEHFSRAGVGPELTEYHLLAGISACHAAAASFDSTDWRRILFYYDALLERFPSPVAALNRAVAVSMVDGPRAGIAALDQIAKAASLRGYHLLPSTYAELYERMGERNEAHRYYRRALGEVKNAAERRFLEHKMERCEGAR